MIDKKLRPIGQILAEIQGELSQEEFSARCGLSQSLISRVIRVNYLPKASTIRSIVANLGIEHTPLGQEFLAYASPEVRARERASPARLRYLQQGISQFVRDLPSRRLLTYQPRPVTAPLGEEEAIVPVLTPVRTTVKPPFFFSWEYVSMRGKTPTAYRLVVRCGSEKRIIKVPAERARKFLVPKLGREAEIICVGSPELDLPFEISDVEGTWQVEALDEEDKVIASSGKISFRLDPHLSDTDLLLLGLLLEGAGQLDDAMDCYGRISNEYERYLALVGIMEKRLRELKVEEKRLEDRALQDEQAREQLDQLRIEKQFLVRMADLYWKQLKDLEGPS